MSSKPIGYGIVGLGRAGWDIHIKALRDRKDAKIAAVVDPLPERRQQAIDEFGCQAYEKLSDMLKQKDVEVAVIATPSVMHGPDTIQCLKAGKHVVVEKPMAMSVAEADRMIRTARQARRRLFVHQNYRFFPEFIHLQEVVSSGKIGKLYHVRNYLSHFSRRNDWQTLARNGGGVLNNTCPHFLDMLLQLLGAPVVQVMGDLQRIASSGDVEDHVKAFIRAANGVTADIEVSSAQNLPAPLPKWILCGSCGTLVSDGKTSTIRYYDPRKVKPLPVIDGPAWNRRYGNDDKLPWKEEVVPAVGTDKTGYYDNVFSVIRQGGKMRVTPESVREVIRTIALIRKGTDFPGKPNAKKCR